MAERLVSVLVGVLPLFLLLPLFTGLFGGMFGGGLTAYVFDVVSASAPKTGVTAVYRQYSGIPSMANYIKLYYLSLGNSGTTDLQVKVRIAEMNDTTTPLSSTNDVTKLIVPAGGNAQYEIAYGQFASLGQPDASTLNGKYLRFEFDQAVNVNVAGVMFLSLPSVQASISKAT